MTDFPGSRGSGASAEGDVDEGTPVTDAYTSADGQLTGRTHRVTVEVG
jgi:hypothetical protein